MEVTTSGNHATLFFSSFEFSIKELLIFQPNSVNLSYPSRSLFVMKMVTFISIHLVLYYLLQSEKLC